MQVNWTETRWTSRDAAGLTPCGWLVPLCRESGRHSRTLVVGAQATSRGSSLHGRPAEPES